MPKKSTIPNMKLRRRSVERLPELSGTQPVEYSLSTARIPVSGVSTRMT